MGKSRVFWRPYADGSQKKRGALYTAIEVVADKPRRMHGTQICRSEFIRELVQSLHVYRLIKFANEFAPTGVVFGRLKKTPVTGTGVFHCD
jgi:hypothetical protein